MRVAINGVGVAGPTLAYWLRRYGHEPVLFERAPALRPGGYIIDFWGLGYEIAERMEILQTLRERGYEMERMLMVDRDGRVETTVDLAPMRRAANGRFISVARADLAAALFRACDGIPVQFGTHVASIEQGDRGAVVTLSDGRKERFDLVIGADGLHSQVRELEFGPQSRFERFLDCYVAAFRLKGYPRRDELAHVSRTVLRRQAARVSLRDDETLVLLVCRADCFDGEPARDEQKAALRRAFGDMGWEVPDLLQAMDGALDFYFDRLSQIEVPRWAEGRVGLIGDAAACPSLLAGEGTGLGMVEAYVLAGEIHRAGADYHRAFTEYDRQLRPFVTAKQKAALSYRGFFAPGTPLGFTVRNIAVRALSIPFISKRLLGRSLHDDFELPRYAAA